MYAACCKNLPLQGAVGHFHKLEKLGEGETRSREREAEKGWRRDSEEIGGLRTIFPVPPSASTCILIRDIVLLDFELALERISPPQTEENVRFFPRFYCKYRGKIEQILLGLF